MIYLLLFEGFINGQPSFLSEDRNLSFYSHDVLIEYFPGPGAID